jgi:hypothetical protein
MTEYHHTHEQIYDHSGERLVEHAIDVPEHVNDRQGIVSLFLMGLAILLLLLLVIAVVQAI